MQEEKIQWCVCYFKDFELSSVTTGGGLKNHLTKSLNKAGKTPVQLNW